MFCDSLRNTPNMESQKSAHNKISTPFFKKGESHPIAINRPVSLSLSLGLSIMSIMEQHADANLVRNLPERIRVSIGSAIVLGLLEGKLDAEPTTAYLMTYKTGKCTANCSFCPQAKTSLSNAELLSRISWPTFPTKNVLKGIGNAVNDGKIKRVCIQALNYPNVFQHLVALVKMIKQHATVPVSISCQPLNSRNTRRLAEAGAYRISIALDAQQKSALACP